MHCKVGENVWVNLTLRLEFVQEVLSCEETPKATKQHHLGDIRISKEPNPPNIFGGEKAECAILRAFDSKIKILAGWLCWTRKSCDKINNYNKFFFQGYFTSCDISWIIRFLILYMYINIFRSWGVFCRVLKSVWRKIQ